jgi:hypothetical protein
MRGERLITANKIAEKVWHKYHDLSIELELSFHGEFDPDSFPPIGAYRKTKVFCSNPFCCGNPRRIRGAKNGTLTIQELRELEKDTDFVW